MMDELPLPLDLLKGFNTLFVPVRYPRRAPLQGGHTVVKKESLFNTLLCTRIQLLPRSPI